MRCKNSRPPRSNRDVRGGIPMENYLKSIVVRFRAIFPAQRRLVFAGCLLAVVFFFFFSAANLIVRPGEHASPSSPNAGSLTGAVPPPRPGRSTRGDAQ